MTRAEVEAARERSVEKLKIVRARFEEVTILRPELDSWANFSEYVALTQQMTALEKGILYFDRLIQDHYVMMPRK